MDYGSGIGADWTGYSNSISPLSIINQVLAADGLFMFGDSISVATGKNLAEMLIAKTGDIIAVNNWSSRPTPPAVDALEAWSNAYGLPRRILMATGTNDIFNPPLMAAQIDRVMNIVGPDRTVIWVDVQCSRWAYSSAIQVADQRNSGWINNQIQAATKRWPNLLIIPWNYWLSVNPSRLQMYLKDGVHCTLPGAQYDGQAFRNTIIANFIAAELSGAL